MLLSPSISQNEYQRYRDLQLSFRDVNKINDILFLFYCIKNLSYDLKNFVRRDYMKSVKNMHKVLEK